MHTYMTTLVRALEGLYSGELMLLQRRWLKNT